MKTINIMLACDHRIAKYIPPLICGVCKNNPGYFVAFYVCHYRIEPGDLTDIRTTGEKFGAAVHEVCVDPALFRPFETLDETQDKQRWPQEAYYYLLPHWILPESLERALYLDLDLTVSGTLDGYYLADFGDAYVAVNEVRKPLPDAEQEIMFLPASERFNSGVVLLNLSKFRRDINMKFYEDVYAEARARGISEMLLADQGIANMAFHDKALYVDNKYNNSCLSPDMDSVVSHLIGYTYKPWDLRFEPDSGVEEFLRGKYPERLFRFARRVNKIWWDCALECPSGERLLDEARIRAEAMGLRERRKPWRVYKDAVERVYGSL